MMTADVVQMAPAGRARDWPLVVPRGLFTRWQPTVGATATLLWLNLYEMAEGGVTAEYVSVEAELAARMGVAAEEVAAAAVALERARLLRRQGGRWTVLWPPAERGEDTAPEAAAATTAPADFPPAMPEEAPQPSAPASAPPPNGSEEPGWNTEEAGLQAVVQFYHQRIGMLGPSQFEKLRFWVEEQGMSSDVVALAIEETVQSAPNPRLPYVEGVLRNWYNAGVRTVADLQKSKGARSQEVTPTVEGAPNAAAFEAVDRDAVRRWREMYADEYDD